MSRAHYREVRLYVQQITAVDVVFAMYIICTY